MLLLLPVLPGKVWPVVHILVKRAPFVHVSIKGVVYQHVLSRRVMALFVSTSTSPHALTDCTLCVRAEQRAALACDPLRVHHSPADVRHATPSPLQEST